ncbi:hypothetical protein THRCLA_01492 [Thraustotheca clavata]|uniref:Secreted protein n=1 Tax=Thraustotheca clavata TaxID=74557 RepID=A0A1W0A8B1_9STRA|nr:hypothetical protein THRCLA_01492 [Thraustotheca clavata]
MKMLHAAAFVMAMLAPVILAEDECCAKCLSRLGPATYDVTNFQQCSGNVPGCCFKCDQDTTLSSPSFLASMAAGTYQKIAWSDPAKVTVVTLVGSAATTSHTRPQPLGTQAQKDSKGNYLFCMDSPGVILFRGFGPTPTGTACQTMSAELSINVTVGAAGASCTSSKSNTTTTSGSSSGTNSGKTTAPPVVCDAQRGFVENGECKCTSDYSGPPACNGLSTWKLVVSIAGGVAALFSIIISVRQFMLWRKKKEEERQLATQRHSKDDVEVMAISAAPDYYDAKRTPHTQARTPGRSPGNAMKPYPVDSHQNLSPRQSKEYTL